MLYRYINSCRSDRHAPKTQMAMSMPPPLEARTTWRKPEVIYCVFERLQIRVIPPVHQLIGQYMTPTDLITHLNGALPPVGSDR